jgi:hypothetical protein
MGGSESNTVEVEDIRKSNISRKSPASKSPKALKSPQKASTPAPTKQDQDFTIVEDFKSKRSGSLLTDPSRHTETSESRTKKKIKSVKVLPAALDRYNIAEDP